jgi:hypothetical protein
VLAAALLPWHAAAHEANPTVRVTLDPPPEAVAGMEIAVAASVADQLVLTNETDRRVEVLDENGDAFLRIGPRGVLANLSSPAWYRTNSPLGLARVPSGVRAGATPRWARVAADPSWGWFDHRLHPAEVTVPPDVRNAGEPAELGRWSVPLRVGTTEVELTGAIRFEPILGTLISELTEPPDVRGLTLTTLAGRVPGMFLDNQTGRRVTVLGAAGEPFLRFGERGVEANVHSPSWLAARRAEGGPVRPSLVDADSPPAWRSVSKVPRFGWIEPRAAYPLDTAPGHVIEAGQPATLNSWTLPLRVGNRTVRAAGVVRWQPVAHAEDPAAPDDGGGVPTWVWAAGAAAVAAGALGIARRRTNRVSR